MEKWLNNHKNGVINISHIGSAWFRLDNWTQYCMPRLIDGLVKIDQAIIAKATKAPNAVAKTKVSTKGFSLRFKAPSARAMALAA